GLAGARAAGQIAAGQGRCAAFFYMLFASPRDSTPLNDYSHLRGFRRVGMERVELLICLNVGLVSSAVNAAHGAGGANGMSDIEHVAIGNRAGRRQRS